MQVLLDYGKSGLRADLPDPNVVGVLSLTPAPAVADPDAVVRAALRQPINACPLTEAARGKRTACIVVCDLTRPVPNAVLLPPILDALRDVGIDRDGVTILLATGTHRPNAGAELDFVLGSDIARSGLRIVNHDCDDREAHRFFGTTENGVPVWLDRVYTDADVKVTVGLIEPHFMAGYSGGRKLLMPGIAARETIQAWHSPRFLEHPRATGGVVIGNPVHEENTRIALLCPPDLIVDVTLDEAKQITGVFVGEMEAAWAEGVRFAERHVRAVLDSPPVDIVVTTGAGWPLDATFYQAVKGVVGALPIVRPGGTIIIAADCSEGIGGPDFTRLLLETLDLSVLMTAMQADDWQMVPDQWQVEELAKAVRDHRVSLVSGGITPDLAARLFVTPFASVEAAVADALNRYGKDATIAVIPKGPYVLPVLAEPV